MHLIKYVCTFQSENLIRSATLNNSTERRRLRHEGSLDQTHVTHARTASEELNTSPLHVNGGAMARDAAATSLKETSAVCLSLLFNALVIVFL